MALKGISFTGRAFGLYEAFCASVALAIEENNLHLRADQQPLEKAEEQGDGTLRVWVELPCEATPRVEYRVPAQDWAWASAEC